jgi:hypothetical protein
LTGEALTVLVAVAGADEIRERRQTGPTVASKEPDSLTMVTNGAPGAELLTGIEFRLRSSRPRPGVR